MDKIVYIALYCNEDGENDYRQFENRQDATNFIDCMEYPEYPLSEVIEVKLEV